MTLFAASSAPAPRRNLLQTQVTNATRSPPTTVIVHGSEAEVRQLTFLFYARSKRMDFQGKALLPIAVPERLALIAEAVPLQGLLPE